jgi:hypothetical protein
MHFMIIIQDVAISVYQPPCTQAKERKMKGLAFCEPIMAEELEAAML